MNSTNDWFYYRIIQTKDRGRMYRYKLIESIIKDLDDYLEENEIDTFDNEEMLLSYIDYLFKKNSPNIFRYFTLFGGPKFKKQISIDDIKEWTHKYKKKNRLYSNNGMWLYK